MTSTDPLNLDAIEARATAATPGPWCIDSWEIYQGTEYVAGAEWIGETCRAGEMDNSRADAEFVAAARTDVPALLAEVRRLRTELAATRADVFAEVANELESIDFHPNAKATCTDLCRQLAGRFRRKGLAAIDSALATETHVVADGSDDPEHIDDCPGCEARVAEGAQR